MNASSALVTYVANAVWQVTVIAAVGWIASRLLGRLGARVEHIGWVSTLAVALLAPAAPVFGAWLSALMAGASSGGNASIAIVASQADATVHRQFILLPAWAMWLLLAVYITSLLYFAARLAWSLYRTVELLQSGSALALTPEQEELWKRCRESIGVGEARILQSGEISGPVVLGWQRPVLLVPEGFAENCAPEDLLAALAHECAHAKRHDFGKNLVYEAVSLALAFHPAIWMIKSRIAQTREMVCDSMVTDTVLESRNYAHSLLRLAAMAGASQPVAAQVIGIFDANILEKRIMTMNRKKRRFGSAVRFGLIAPAVLLLISSGLIAAARSVVIQPAQGGNAEPYGHVYKVGDGVTAPVPLKVVPAKFSKQARRAHYQGVCVIKLIVDAEGIPRDAHVTRRLGMGLDEKALEAVHQYRFKPAMRDGQPVAVGITMEVDFKLY